MSLEQFGESSEVKHSAHFVFDSTPAFSGECDSTEGTSIKEELKKIRSENPNLYKAFSLDKFD